MQKNINIAKRQRSRDHGLKSVFVLGVLVSISLLVLAGCPANPSQGIIRDKFDRITRDPNDPQAATLPSADLGVTVELTSNGKTVGVYNRTDNKGSVLQGDSVQITATVRNNSTHASNGYALLVFYESEDEIVNPALFDIGLDYEISDSAIKAIEEALYEGYGLDPALSAALREQDLNEQDSADANKKLVVDPALDPIFASVVVPPLAGGKTFELAEPIKIPDTIDVGSLNYGACVVLDRFGCNSVALEVTVAQKPDLRAVGAPKFTLGDTNAAPSDGYYTNGNTVTVTGTVENTGGAAASNVMVTLYRVGDNGVGAPVSGDGATTTISIEAAKPADSTTNPPTPFTPATSPVTFTFSISERSPGIDTEEYYFQITAVDNELDKDLATNNNRSDNNELIVYVPDGRSGSLNLYDSDGDLLIDVRNLEMLDNIRRNLHGTSYIYPDPNNANATITKQCGSGTTECEGYELMQDLDFASASSYEGYRVNDAWRPNHSDPARATDAGWAPIGGNFSAIFEGNGHTIHNLYSRNLATTGGAAYGLFSQVSGTVRNLTVQDSAIYGSPFTDYIGTVVGYLHAGGKVINVSARRGVVHSGNAGRNGIFANLGHSSGRYYVDNPRINGGMDIAGGLVGTNAGKIAASSSAVTVIGSNNGDTASYLNRWAYADKLGGLVGDNVSAGEIIASYSLSAVIGDDNSTSSKSSDRVGGIVGTNYGKILSSYSLSNLNGQGEVDYIGGITGGLGYPPTANPNPNADDPMIFSTYTTATMYGSGVEYGAGRDQSGDDPDWNCVGAITGFNYHARTDIEGSHFFGKANRSNRDFNCSVNDDSKYISDIGINQLSSTNLASTKDNGVSSRAWAYPTTANRYGAPALKYADYDGDSGINYCMNTGTTTVAGTDADKHINDCNANGGLLLGQPLTDQGNTMGAAYSVDTPFYPGGGLSIPATIHSGGDNDYFKITVIKAGEIVIESLHSRGVNMQVQLLDKYGNLVEYDDFDGEGNNFRIYRYIPRGEYTIRAYAHGNATGSYIISMQMVGQALPTN